MTENTIGMWHAYAMSGTIAPASPTGVVGLGYVGKVPSGMQMATVTIEGFNATFNVIDLTETAESPNAKTSYRGGIQSVDKSFSSAPVLIPIPLEFPIGYDIGFVESSVLTIAGVWFDGLHGRDQVMEDLRTSKKLVTDKYRMSPYVFLLSDRAYFVMMTGYSSNIVGGQGDIISFRLGLSISSGNSHYL